MGRRVRLEVPYGAKDPEASYEFIKYLSTPEVQEKFGEKSFDIMANRTANENLVNNDNLDENGQMIYQMADENFANTVITPVPLTAPDFSSLVNEQIDQIMLGSKTPAERLADAQKRWKILLSKTNKLQNERFKRRKVQSVSGLGFAFCEADMFS